MNRQTGHYASQASIPAPLRVRVEAVRRHAGGQVSNENGVGSEREEISKAVEGRQSS